MDTEQLNKIFYPTSIAIVGASNSKNSVGYSLLNNLLSGGYKGEIYPINPNLKEIQGLRSYTSLSEVKKPIDLILISRNQYATIDVIKEAGKIGVSGAVCVAGGYKELGEEGKNLENRLISVARRENVNIVGPNTLGIINTDVDLNATFYPLRLKKGSISFLTQSGGVGFNFLVKCIDEKLGISKWIGVGNGATIDFSDYLEYLENDPTTSTIGIFLEGTDKIREFIKIANRIVKSKPIVVLKIGRSELAKYSASTHTGSMAASYKIYMDIFKQFGIITVSNISELVAACKALAISQILPKGPRVGILTHTAGPSIIAVDELYERGCIFNQLTHSTVIKLKKIMGEKPPVVLKNPLDAPGVGFEASNFGKLAEILLEEPNIDILLAIYCIHEFWKVPNEELIKAFKKYKKPIIVCYISTYESYTKNRKPLEEAGIPVFSNIDDAIIGIDALVKYSNILKQHCNLS